MALLQAVLDRISALVNIEPKIATAIADDGSGDPIDAGKPSPLRADPTTGALITTGSGDVTDPVFTQDVAADSLVFTEHTVTNASAALPVLTTPYGFEIQVPAGAAGNVFVREIATVTATGVGRGWQVAAGTSKHFNAPSTTGWTAIASAASVEILIVHEADV